MGRATKVNILIGLTFYIIIQILKKFKSRSICFYDVDDLKFVENTEESIMDVTMMQK